MSRLAEQTLAALATLIMVAVISAPLVAAPAYRIGTAIAVPVLA